MGGNFGGVYLSKEEELRDILWRAYYLRYRDSDYLIFFATSWKI